MESEHLQDLEVSGTMNAVETRCRASGRAAARPYQVQGEPPIPKNWERIGTMNLRRPSPRPSPIRWERENRLPRWLPWRARKHPRLGAYSLSRPTGEGKGEGSWGGAETGLHFVCFVYFAIPPSTQSWPSRCDAQSRDLQGYQAHGVSQKHLNSSALQCPPGRFERCSGFTSASSEA
jgi:hypothetical protein